MEESNLQRQTLFDEADAAQSMPKAIAAARQISSFNSAILVEPNVTDLTPSTVEESLSGIELVMDGTDNFETRYLLNDYCVKDSLPWIYVAAVGSYGITANILPGQTACLTCLFPDPPTGMIETCETAGVLNSAVNLAASIAAAEAVKLLVAAHDKIRRSLLSFDVWNNERSEISTATPRTDCRTCGLREFVHLAAEARPQITLCGRNSVQIHERHRPLDLAALRVRLEPLGSVRQNEFVLKFWHDPHELTVFPDGRAIIKGTTDAAIARSLYARFVGN